MRVRELKVSNNGQQQEILNRRCGKTQVFHIKNNNGISGEGFTELYLRSAERKVQGKAMVMARTRSQLTQPAEHCARY